MTPDIEQFKSAMAHFATGVTVVTTHDGERDFGITVNAFCSVSLEPMLVLVSVDRSLRTHTAIEEGRCYAVNLLGESQQPLGERFAGLIPEIEDRFDGLDIARAVTGAPILPGTLAWVDCRLRHSYPGGDHTLYVGEVVAVEVSAAEPPLLYYNRRWARFGGSEARAGSSWPADKGR